MTNNSSKNENTEIKSDKNNFENVLDTNNKSIQIENSVDKSKPTVMKIDDDIHVREALKFVFEKKFNLILCDSGESGINSLNPNVFVVILDIKMEGKNGFETFIEIKKKNIYIPIIFLTAYQDLKDPMEIMNDYRPFGYVIKGADTILLHDTLESAVNYYSQINKNSFLIKAMQSKNLALQELREDLEKQVEERTHQLALTNNNLLQEIQVRKNAEIEISSLLKDKEIILKEVHHRIKNNMTTLKSILSLQSRTISDEIFKNIFKEMESRIDSMMVLYEKLYESDDFEVLSIKDYTETLLENIISNFPNNTSIRLDLKIQDFKLDAKRLQSLGMIFNEIITNSIKYSFEKDKDKLISLEIKLIEGKVSNGKNTVYITISDNGTGLKQEIDLKNKSGFGFRLIELLSKQLMAELHIEQKNSLKYILEFIIQ